MSTTRRETIAILTGLGSVVAAPATVQLVSQGADPIVLLRQKALALRALMNRPETPGEAAELAFERYTAIDLDVLQTAPVSMAGATAALEWAREEFAEHYSDDGHGGAVVLSLLDGALGILRGPQGAGL